MSCPAASLLDCPFPSRRPAGSAAPTARPGRAVSRWAVVSAALTPVVGTLGWLIADPLQPASYSPIRDTVSVLAGYAGTDRWIMTAAMLLAGGLYFVTAAGLAGIRRFARLLLILTGLALIGIATSPEPAGGPTMRHLVWTVFGAVTLGIWPAFAARRGSPRPLILSVYGSATVSIVFAVLMGWFLVEARGGDMLGLAERVATSTEATWPLVVAVALRRTTPRALPVPENLSHLGG